VGPVPDPLLLRKSGSTRNRIRDVWICSQEVWPLDHRGGPYFLIKSIYLKLYITDIWICVTWLVTYWNPRTRHCSNETNIVKLKLYYFSFLFFSFQSVTDSDVISGCAIPSVKLSWDEMLFRIQISWFPFMESILIPYSNWTLYTKQDRKLMFPHSNSYLDID
jgi:hypothetical protein